MTKYPKRLLKIFSLQGIQFPYAIREQGASVELLKFDAPKEAELTSWAKDNIFERDAEEEKQWGIIAQAKTKSIEEFQFLSLSFRRVVQGAMEVAGGQTGEGRGRGYGTRDLRGPRKVAERVFGTVFLQRKAAHCPLEILEGSVWRRFHH